jgi:hypothetical protein
MTLTLTNPTDDQLNAAFAEKVAGWTLRDEYWMTSPKRFAGRSWLCGNKWMCGESELPPFTTSADAVLPWLEKWNESWEVSYYNNVWNIAIEDRKGGMIYGWVKDKSFPRAAVIALLRAHGVVVEVGT